MKKHEIAKSDEIRGEIAFPAEWTVYAPLDIASPALSGEVLKTIPKEITVNGKTLRAEQVKPTRNQYDFKPFLGEPPYDDTQAVYVFVPLHSESAQEVTLGMGADWFLQVWLNGAPVFDTLEEGNVVSPPAINNHRVTVRLEPGRNVLAIRLINGIASAVLALGGPEELRRGDFKSILPDTGKLDAASLLEKHPSDPEAPIQWRPPAGFDPETPGLGLPLLEEAEHFGLLHCLPSKAPLDEGGTGEYESLQHGTWNHNIGLAVYRNRLIGIWDNHALDENGPGGRVLARVGKVINDRGEVDWGGPENILELAPAPVPVRRRKLHSDRDAIRGAQAKGAFYVIEDRLFFCGRLAAVHGVATNAAHGSAGAGKGKLIPAEHFHFGKGPGALRGGYVHWDLGFSFYQEWGVRDDRLQPVSPIYKENEMPAELALTPELSLPLEPLIPPYRDAPFLSEAPQDIQDLIRNGARKGFARSPRYRPGTRPPAHDGINGLVPGHASEFRRPDGSWVIAIENQGPPRQPFYYAVEKPDVESYYPPARRTSLYGAVKPAAGELPDGRVFIVCNSPNRQNMYITISRDGRVFDKTWLLMHKQLRDYTPGIMKREGGPGAGPQYFVPAVIAESVWLVYSISKEHVGATRIAVSALCH